MLITRISPISGATHTRDLPITREQLASWHREGGTLKVQEAFPELPEGEREFLMTGITPEEWNTLFTEEDGEADLCTLDGAEGDLDEIEWRTFGDDREEPTDAY